MKRLHEVCAAAGLDAAVEQKLATLLELIARDPEAPTAVTDPVEAVDVHIADSLSVIGLLDGRELPRTIADVGSGAGFPGLPLAIALEGAAVDLIESTTRKCRFLERAAATLDLANTRVVRARAEDWAGAKGEERYDLVTARAVAPLATLLEYASPLLRPHGLLIAWKGARDEAEEEQAAAAAQALGMSLGGIYPVTPFTDARHRYLHVFEKTGTTPAGVPRRAGMARKRPFGSESSAPN